MTANLVHKDWTYFTQGVWSQCFPALPGAGDDGTEGGARSRPASPFARDLDEYLAAVQAGDAKSRCPQVLFVRQRLYRYDFRGARGTLVASVPGAHRGLQLFR
jgi:hypothetical protein